MRPFVRYNTGRDGASRDSGHHRVLVLAAPAAGVLRPAITERDGGKTFGVRKGGALTLRLSSESYRWTGPNVRGTAIRLVPVNYVRDPGFREWTIRGRARGTARITAVGSSREAAAIPGRAGFGSFRSAFACAEAE